MLAEWLNVGAESLRYGKGSAAGSVAQQATPSYRSALSDQELVRRYHKLNRTQQQAVAEIITALAAKDRRR